MTPRLRLVVSLLIAGSCAVVFGGAARAAGETPGDPARGLSVFSEKRCVRCHLPRGAQGVGPAVEELRRPQGALELAGRLWNHAPVMFSTLEQKGSEWPRISAAQMADLIAYLLADPSRDAAPDLFRGQVLLIRKGCLKCHRFRREGGTVGIELTTYHDGFQSPVVWAATIWNHSSRMAGHAAKLGLVYPRFTGAEMGDLFGFLKSAAEASPR